MGLILHVVVQWLVVSAVFAGLCFFMPGYRIGARARAARAPEPKSPGGPALARALAASGGREAPRPTTQGTWRQFALAVVAFGGANVLLGWVLGFVVKVLIFLPNILTLGLLGLLVPVVVNAVLLKAIDLKFGEAVEIDGVKPLLIGAGVVSVAAFAVGKVV